MPLISPPILPAPTGWRRYARKLPAGQFLILNLALGVGHFVVLLAAGAFLPMLPYVAGTLGWAMPYAVWGQSNYVAAMAAAFLIARPLMRRHGAKNTALLGYGLFALTGLVVIEAVRVFPLYVGARTLQGVGAGLCVAPSLALLLEHYQHRKRHLATGLWGLAAFVPFSVGPALGGYFAYVLGDWRLMFMAFSAVTLVVAGVVWALLGDRPSHHDPREPLGRHLLVFALFLGAVLALQAFFNLGILTDLTSRAYPSWWILAVFCLLGWLFWVLNGARGALFIDFSLFRQRNFAFGLAVLCLAFIGIQGAIVQYVLRLQSLEGYSAWHAGLLFLPLFVLSKPLSLRAHTLIRRGGDPRILACVGCAGFALSFWWMGEYVRPTTWESLLWPQFLEGASLGLFITAMNALILGHVPEARQLHAGDILNCARTLAAAWIIALSDVFWDRCAASARSHLTSPGAADAWNLIAGFDPGAAAPGTALYHALAGRLAAQTGWLTFSAMFHCLAACFAAGALLVWLADPIRPRPATLPERIAETLGEDL